MLTVDIIARGAYYMGVVNVLHVNPPPRSRLPTIRGKAEPRGFVLQRGEMLHWARRRSW